jgi:hypothetical protein
MAMEMPHFPFSEGESEKRSYPDQITNFSPRAVSVHARDSGEPGRGIPAPPTVAQERNYDWRGTSKANYRGPC